MTDKAKLGFAVLGILAVAAALHMMGNGEQPGKAAPDSPLSDMDPYGVFHPEADGEHFCRPDEIIGPVIFTRHRYPQRAGHEITSLIEQGFQPMIRRKPRDYEWLSEPPGEATL